MQIAQSRNTFVNYVACITVIESMFTRFHNTKIVIGKLNLIKLWPKNTIWPDPDKIMDMNDWVVFIWVRGVWHWSKDNVGARYNSADTLGLEAYQSRFNSWQDKLNTTDYRWNWISCLHLPSKSEQSTLQFLHTNCVAQPAALWFSSSSSQLNSSSQNLQDTTLSDWGHDTGCFF